jgi:hypothetical protein
MSDLSTKRCAQRGFSSRCAGTSLTGAGTVSNYLPRMSVGHTLLAPHHYRCVHVVYKDALISCIMRLLWSVDTMFESVAPYFVTLKIETLSCRAALSLTQPRSKALTAPLLLRSVCAENQSSIVTRSLRCTSSCLCSNGA